MSDKIKCSGPAFPVPGMSGLPNDQCVWPEYGMTLREYFISHAPAEPQPWFVPVMPPEPDNNGFLFRGTRNCGMWKSFADAKYYWGEKNVTSENPDHDAWRKEFSKQRYIQWPAAWADAMLKAREVV